MNDAAAGGCVTPPARRIRCRVLRSIFLAAPLALIAVPTAAADNLSAPLERIESGWAQVQFATADKDAKLAQLDKLLTSASSLEKANPSRAEPLVWRAVLMATKAGVVRGYTGYRLILDAREQLERAEAIAPDAAGGLGLMQLGILYFEVPGPPIAYGNRGKAKAYLQRALALDPKGLSPNLAYANFLVKGARYAEAEPVLERALAAPVDTVQPLADKGRRAEAAAQLKLVRQRLGK
jgi:tetratricopeptide (TPR) repeat protein